MLGKGTSFGFWALGLGLKLGELQLPVSNLAVRSSDAKIPCPSFLDLSEATLGFGDWAVGPPSKFSGFFALLKEHVLERSGTGFMMVGQCFAHLLSSGFSGLGFRGSGLGV